jgi:histidinol-phosphatase
VTVDGYRDLLDFAVEVAWRAGRATLAHYQTGVRAETKPDDSPVTAADHDAERIVRDLLTARFPRDGIVGEEFGEERSGASRRWIVDPIDGTRSFVRGVPLYGVMLALEDEGDAVLGVIHFPALDETVYAARGAGCWWNGRRAIVSDTTHLSHAFGLTTDVENIYRTDRGRGWDMLRSRVSEWRTWGDCYGYALVATGRADFMLDPILSVWDAAAVAPIIDEAGGVFTDWDGEPGYRNGSVIATNAALARDIRAILHGQV